MKLQGTRTASLKEGVTAASEASAQDTGLVVAHIAGREVQIAVDTDTAAHLLDTYLVVADIPAHRVDRIAEVVVVAGRVDRAVVVSAAL